MQLLTVIASAAEGHEAPSKTLYYVAAAVLSAWALLLAGAGIASANVVATDGARRATITITTLLFVGLVAAVLATN